MLNNKSAVLLSGEFGYDETEGLPWPEDVISTHDIEDDDDGEYLPCDPFIDWECDTETIEEDFDGSTKEYVCDQIDIFTMQTSIENCEQVFNNLRLTFYKLYDEIATTIQMKQQLVPVELLIDSCMTDFTELKIYINSPGIYTGDIDMKHNVNTLMTTGLTPNVITFSNVVSRMSQMATNDQK